MVFCLLVEQKQWVILTWVLESGCRSLRKRCPSRSMLPFSHGRGHRFRNRKRTRSATRYLDLPLSSKTDRLRGGVVTEVEEMNEGKKGFLPRGESHTPSWPTLPPYERRKIGLEPREKLREDDRTWGSFHRGPGRVTTIKVLTTYLWQLLYLGPPTSGWSPWGRKDRFHCREKWLFPSIPFQFLRSPRPPRYLTTLPLGPRTQQI